MIEDGSFYKWQFAAIFIFVLDEINSEIKMFTYEEANEEESKFVSNSPISLVLKHWIYQYLLTSNT